MSISEYEDQRYEPRFRPICERVVWRRSEGLSPGAGSLVDVSRGGLSFHVDAHKGKSLGKGEEIRIRHAGFGEASERYAGYLIVWSRPDGEGGRAIGCTRLYPTPCVISKPINPHPLATRNLWDDGLRQSQFSTSARRYKQDLPDSAASCAAA